MALRPFLPRLLALRPSGHLVFLTCLAVLGGGCQDRPVVRPLPIATPTPEPSRAPQPAPSPGSVAFADVGFSVYGGSLVVTVTGGSKPIAGASVQLHGASLVGGRTDATGRLKLGPLIPGEDYRLMVNAEGLQTSLSDRVVIKPREEDVTTLAIALRSEATAAGRITAAGAPVADAVVSDGLNSALTDADGRYLLRGVAPGPVTLTASKPRFRTATRTISVAAGVRADADLALLATTPEVHLDLSAGTSLDAAAVNGLRQRLGTRGWTVLEAPPAQDGVWVLVAPGRDLSAAEQERMVTFVAQGGKLLVLGDWGGQAGFRTGAVNGVLHRLGLHQTADLVRDTRSGLPTSSPRLTRFPAGPLAGSGLALQLYGAASVFALAPMGTLATSSDSAFRVQAGPNVGPQALIAGGPYRGGKALVVGDATAFTDEDADGNRRPNLDEADNAAAFERLLDW